MTPRPATAYGVPRLYSRDLAADLARIEAEDRRLSPETLAYLADLRAPRGRMRRWHVLAWAVLVIAGLVLAWGAAAALHEAAVNAAAEALARRGM